MSHVLRRAATVVAALALGVASAATASTAAAAETGLSGVVTSEDGTPIAACVTAYTVDYQHAGSTCTQDGAWSIPELADGAYRVRADAVAPHISEWAHDTRSFEEATDVVAPGTVDFALTPGGILAGTLTDSDGAPVAGASIWALEEASLASGTETPVESATSDAAGDWSMVVRPGPYKVSMHKWPAEVWAFGATSAETATTIDVIVGATTRVDNSFLPAAKVSGLITAAKTKEPVAGACATLLSPASSPDGEAFGFACADETGAYELTAWAEGTYVMLFTEPSGRFATEYSGGAATISQAKTIRVVAGSTATASAALDLGAVLKGRVVSSVSGEGIPDVCPGAYSGRTGPYVPGQVPTCTDDSGSYELGGLSAAPTTVSLSPGWDSGTAGSWYLGATDQASATVVRPKVGRVTTLQDMQIEPAGTVTGVVTDGLGNPVPFVHVNLLGLYGGRSGGCESPVCGYTDESGRYTVSAPAGTYTPFFWSYNGGWAPEWSGDATTKATAAPVTVTSGEETTLDAVLEQGGQITGTVVNADGSQPTQYALGTVFTESGDYIGDFDAYSASEWTFGTSTLPAGNFRLQVRSYDEATGTSTDSWYDGSTTEAGATLVSLSKGEVKDLTYHLP